MENPLFSIFFLVTKCIKLGVQRNQTLRAIPMPRMINNVMASIRQLFSLPDELFSLLPTLRELVIAATAKSKGTFWFQCLMKSQPLVVLPPCKSKHPGSPLLNLLLLQTHRQLKIPFFLIQHSSSSSSLKFRNLLARFFYKSQRLKPVLYGDPSQQLELSLQKSESSINVAR